MDFLANSLVQDLTFSNLKQFGFEWRSSYPLGIHWWIPHFSAGCEAASLHRQFEWCVRLFDATNHSFTEAVVSSVKDFKWRDLQFFMFVCWLGDDSTAANCDYQWFMMLQRFRFWIMYGTQAIDDLPDGDSGCCWDMLFLPDAWIPS